MKNFLIALSASAVLLSGGMLPQPEQRHIPWEFVTHDAPGFDARPIGSFSPQLVHYHYRTNDGWIYISTYRGREWVYYRSNRRRTDRMMGMFNDIEDMSYVSLISPQVVNVIQQQGRWLQIHSYLGPRWINLDFTPTTAHLQAFLQQHGNRLSVFYKNMDSGFTFTYNPNRVFFGASTNKVYSALYIYTLAERGYITLDGIHTYTAADHRGGSGRIQHMSFGTQFTTAQLLNHSIRYSCNVAYRMLALRYNHRDFTFFDFAREIGANRAMLLSLTAKNVTATDAAVWMNALFHYLESGGRYSHVLRNDLIYAFGTIVSDNYDVALKYGWMDANFHDMAIVYAPSPYILIIMSDMGEIPGAGFGLFGRIGRMFEEFNDRYFR